MLMTSAIPNLINGVSQQPFNLRLSSQSEAQTNMLSSVVDGLSHRPSSRTISRLGSAGEQWDDSFVHIINRDRNERYVAAIRDGEVRVFDIRDGEEMVVNTPNGTAYLQSDEPNTGFRAITVADYTIIVNRSKPTQMAPDLAPEPENAAIVQIRGGNYGRTYEVRVNNQFFAGHSTPSGSDADAHPPLIDTKVIAGGLKGNLETKFSGTTFSVEQVEDVLIIRNSASEPVSVSVTDGAGNINIASFARQTQRFSDLPEIAFNGFRMEITGDNNNGFGNYFVEFQTDSDSAAGGVWKEVMKGGETFRLDKETMPHTLRREADGTFTFTPLDWSDREVGDTQSIPNPSFIGRPLNDVFFFRNRLGFIADENVVMSRNADFFDLWRRTATILTDGDPIDIAVTHTRVSILNHAVPFNESLLLFSDQTQFILDSGDILTPTTVAIQQATEFESNSETRPVGVGEFVYFPVNRGSFTGVREFYVDGTTAAKSSNDVTAHCPRYIPSDVFRITASTSEDVITVLSRKQRNKTWVHKYYNSNKEKLQSSWSEWEFGPHCKILNMEFIESSLVFLASYPDGVYLEVIDIESGAADENSDLLYRMDRKVYEDKLSMVFGGDGYTHITLPYEEEGDLWVITRPLPPEAPETDYPAGYSLQYERVDASTIKVEGDWADSLIMVGRRIRSEYEFSTMTLRTEEPSGGQTGIGEGRLQILYLSLEYSRSGYFEVHVEAEGRPPKVRKFNGNILGSSSTKVGGESLQTGRIKVPVFSRNTQVKIKIVTDSFLPAYFMSAEWEGRYTTRARRA